MKSRLDHLEEDGILIIMAYPETLVPACYKMWYNVPLSWLGIIQEGKLCAGHATIALIKKGVPKIAYADFGRYITPYGKGRVRMEETDPELAIPIIPTFDHQGNLINLKEILLYLEAHPEKTHGDGPLVASVCSKVNYQKARDFMEKSCFGGSIPYGPFDLNGTNCSRFVADVVKKSCTDRRIRRKLRFSKSLSPSPLGNVYTSNTEDHVYKVFQGAFSSYKAKRYLFSVFAKLRPSYLRKALKDMPQANEKASSIGAIPTHAQWLSGTGAGAWFVIDRVEDQSKNRFKLRRFTKEGELIFERLFELASDQHLDLTQDYTIVHDTNAYWCTVVQLGKKLIMNSLSNHKRDVFKEKFSHSTILSRS